MSTLLADLHVKGLLSETPAVLGTDFGRTPWINDNDGRDHHDKAFTYLLAGAGIKCREVYGKGGRPERCASLVDRPDLWSTPLPDFLQY